MGISPPTSLRFLSIAESEIGVGVDFSLESMSKKLGTNRRRIYDIINVLEALEMIVKQSKNWYTWLGQGNLLVTLAKMKVGGAESPNNGTIFLWEIYWLWWSLCLDLFCYLFQFHEGLSVW